MPLITPIGELSTLAILGGGSNWAANGGIARYLSAHIAGGSGFTARGSFISVRGKVTFAGDSEFSAFGRLNGEPNKFGVVDLGGGSVVDLSPTTAIGGKMVAAGLSTLSARGRVALADSAEMKIFLTVAPPPAVGYAATYSARVFADGVSYPIRGFDLSEGRQSSGIEVNLTLAKPGDRAAILAAGLFTFDVYDNGNWKTLFSGGKLAGGEFSFAWQGFGPANTLSISTVGQVDDQLAKSPPNNLTVYDPFREDIDASAYRSVFDENGIEYAHQLTAISDMRLNDLFRFVFVTKCGFAGYQTNLPNWPIRRATFQMTGTYLDGIRGVIGIFNPLIFAENDIVYILDSTLVLPAGFAQPVELPATQYLNAQFRETKQDADGIVLQYLENESEFDYYSDREVSDGTDTTGEPGTPGYTESDRSQTFRDYYRYSNPASPVRTEKIKELTTVRAMVNTGGYSGLQTITEIVETVTLDSKGRHQSIVKEISALVPNIGPPHTLAFQPVETETTRFEYSPDYFDPKREFLSKTTKEITGFIATDTDPDAENLGQPFRQRFYDAWRGGNITDTTELSSGPIRSFVERITQTGRGQLEVRAKTVDFMTDPPAITHTPTDVRSGDISQSASNSQTAELIVYRQGVTARAGRKLITLAIGDLPLIYGIPLAKRRLQLGRRRSGSITLKGLNLNFVRGSVLRLLDANGSAVGNFLVEGRSISGANLGAREQQTRQILEVVEI
jgi:hypothetical protein